MNRIDPSTGRLTIPTVQAIERLVGGEPVVEGLILWFIAQKYSARNLFFLPDKVAGAILKRPAEFICAAKASVL